MAIDKQPTRRERLHFVGWHLVDLAALVNVRAIDRLEL